MRMIATLVLALLSTPAAAQTLLYDANPPVEGMERPVQWCDFGAGADDFPMSFRENAWWFGCPPWRDVNHRHDLALHAVFWPDMMGLYGESMFGKRLKFWLKSGGFHMPEWAVLGVHMQVWAPSIGKYANYLNTSDDFRQCVLGAWLLHDDALIMDWTYCEVTFDDAEEWVCLGASPENAGDYGCVDSFTALNLPLYNMIIVSAVPKDGPLAGSPVEMGFRMELWDE